jgi:hypothetical protein
MSVAPDSLEHVFAYLAEKENDDFVYEILTRPLPSSLSTIIKRLEYVDSAKKQDRRRGKTTKQFESQRSRLKGGLYERLVEKVVGSVKCFSTWRSVHTSTNELDILVMLGPTANWVPALREWGTHCVCECKYHSTHVSTDWVTKLNTVLQTHSASVGLLFSRKGIATTGRGLQIRHLQQLLAVSGSPRFIICLSWDDLISCCNGENFLKLASVRFVEMRAGVQRLAMATAP